MGRGVYTEAAFIVKVTPHNEECFHIYSSHQHFGTLYGNFELLDDETLKAIPTTARPSPLQDAVSLIVLDSENQRTLFRSRRGRPNGSFTVSLKPQQRIQLCIQNGVWSSAGGGGGGRNTGRHKIINGNGGGKTHTVGFHVTFEATDPVVELQMANKNLLTSSQSLHRELTRLQDHYTYMRAKEATHRETVEQTFSRLMAWVLLQGLVVIVVAAAQIMYFRRFLERRRYI